MKHKDFKADHFDDGHGHYDYHTIFSYLDDVDIVEVWGARSVGKTSGLR